MNVIDRCLFPDSLEGLAKSLSFARLPLHNDFEDHRCELLSDLTGFLRYMQEPLIIVLESLSAHRICHRAGSNSSQEPPGPHRRIISAWAILR